MNILITNDDGINAEGIKNLVEALQDRAQIYVAAPDGQRSAASHSISLHYDIKAKEVEYDGAVRALSITGTPADCVKVGLRVYELEGIKFDYVFAGINHGANLGMDTHYSGTVSAAMEASICGITGIAVSIDSRKKIPDNFDQARYAAQKVFDKLQEDAVKKMGKMVLSVNVPDIPLSELKGIRQTELGVRDYSGWFVPPKKNADGDWEFRYNGLPEIDKSENQNFDTVAVESGYASITPLNDNYTHRGRFEEIRNWKL